MGMFDFDNKDFVGVPSGKYFDMVRGIDELTAENKSLKHRNENQANTIVDMRNEITDLKRQNGDLCELVGKTKDELRSLQDENAARIEAYEQLDKRYAKLSHEYSKSMGENAACVIENYRLRRKLDAGCNTCPDMENTKKKNDELKKEVEDLRGTISRMHGGCERAIELRRLLDELFDIKPSELVYDDEIRQRMKDLRAGAKDLQEQNQILKDKNDELRELIDFKRNQIEEQANTIRDLDKKLAELRAGANESSAEIHDLKRALKSAEDDILEYRKANYALRKQLESPCETCDVPDNCVNASEAVLKDADAKIQSANDKAANAKKEAKQAKETAERYREENFVLRKKLEQANGLNDSLIKELSVRTGGFVNGNANSD